MNRCNMMVQDLIYPNHFVPTDLRVLDKQGRVTDAFSCEEYCSMMKQNCDSCKIQEVFDKLAKYESYNKNKIKEFHLEQIKCLVYLIGQCDIILQQIGLLINELEQ